VRTLTRFQLRGLISLRNALPGLTADNSTSRTEILRILRYLSKIRQHDGAPFERVIVKMKNTFKCTAQPKPPPLDKRCIYPIPRFERIQKRKPGAAFVKNHKLITAQKQVKTLNFNNTWQSSFQGSVINYETMPDVCDRLLKYTMNDLWLTT
jgi:hypothetical protein